MVTDELWECCEGRCMENSSLVPKVGLVIIENRCNQKSGCVSGSYSEKRIWHKLPYGQRCNYIMWLSRQKKHWGTFGKRPRVRFYQLQLTEINRPECKLQTLLLMCEGRSRIVWQYRKVNQQGQDTKKQKSLRKCIRWILTKDTKNRNIASGCVGGLPTVCPDHTVCTHKVNKELAGMKSENEFITHIFHNIHN